MCMRVFVHVCEFACFFFFGFSFTVLSFQFCYSLKVAGLHSNMLARSSKGTSKQVIVRYLQTHLLKSSAEVIFQSLLPPLWKTKRRIHLLIMKHVIHSFSFSPCDKIFHNNSWLWLHFAHILISCHAAHKTIQPVRPSLLLSEPNRNKHSTEFTWCSLSTTSYFVPLFVFCHLQRTRYISFYCTFHQHGNSECFR